MGKREADKKKTFTQTALPPEVASTEDNGRALEMCHFFVPIYIQAHFITIAGHSQGKGKEI